jgi:hypothetical protein
MKPAFLVSLLAALALGAALLTLNILRPGPDNGRIEAACGVGGALDDLRWEPERVPLQVLVDESAGEWTGAIIDAAKAWNLAAGRDLLRVEPATPTAWVDFADALAGIRPEPAGRVLFFAGDNLTLSGPKSLAVDDEDAVARLRWRFGTCALGYAVVRLRASPEPLAPEAMREVALHELGHVLGLAHDGLTRSVMVRRVRAPEPGEPRFPHEITAHDAAIVAQ